METKELMDAFGRMCLIRHMEKRIAVLYANDAIPGFVHTSIGQGRALSARCSTLVPRTSSPPRIAAMGTSSPRVSSRAACWPS